mmetsp:Transcript_13720/g.39150  ORF Transcript_13720/g.39150 Transcript_13720/m.39150 type:complete len:150 (-) Transcript_13720:203-652(-)
MASTEQAPAPDADREDARMDGKPREGAQALDAVDSGEEASAEDGQDPPAQPEVQEASVPEKYSLRNQKMKQIREQRQAFDKATTRPPRKPKWNADVAGSDKSSQDKSQHTADDTTLPGEGTLSFLVSIPRRILLSLACCLSEGRRDGSR